jgi:hypothetical protein
MIIISNLLKFCFKIFIYYPWTKYWKPALIVTMILYNKHTKFNRIITLENDIYWFLSKIFEENKWSDQFSADTAIINNGSNKRHVNCVISFE